MSTTAPAAVTRRGQADICCWKRIATLSKNAGDESSPMGEYQEACAPAHSKGSGVSNILTKPRPFSSRPLSQVFQGLDVHALNRYCLRDSTAHCLLSPLRLRQRRSK